MIFTIFPTIATFPDFVFIGERKDFSDEGEERRVAPDGERPETRGHGQLHVHIYEQRGVQ